MLTLEGKIVAVTGSSGFLPSHLIDALTKEKPKKIIGLSRRTGHDVTNFAQMADDLRGVDVVFDLATLSLGLSLQVPHLVSKQIYEMALNMAELCRVGVVKTLIHISSSEVYGSSNNIMDEKHPLNPTTPYAGAKAAADKLIESYMTCFDIDCCIVRPFNMYGPRQPVEFGGVIPSVITRISRGEKLVMYGDGNQTRDFSFVEDIAQGIIALYKEPKSRGKVINLASGQSTSIKELVSILSELMEYKEEPKWGKKRLGEVQTHTACIKLAKKLIGYKPSTTLRDGLKETIEWFG